jgi:hypothetical protein
VTDLGFMRLKGLTRLQYLLVCQAPGVTDAGLAVVENFKDLEEFGLCGARITDEGLAHLAPLKKLKVLYLEDTGITGSGMGHLKQLQSLCWLDLQDTQVSDAAIGQLKELKDIPGLTLCLRGTKVTPAGKAELQQALPQCRIDDGR